MQRENLKGQGKKAARQSTGTKPTKNNKEMEENEVSFSLSLTLRGCDEVDGREA